MKNSSHKRAHAIIVTVVLVIGLLSVAGCSFVRQAIAALRSTDNFIHNEHDKRVLFETNAEDYANKVALFLPSAIQQVEEKQYRSFAGSVRVYVCASRESFIKYYGADVRARVLIKLFLAPRVFDYGDQIAKKYLIHELSHLHLQQQIGIYKMTRLPMWFKEGLATYVASGGGAHLISEKQAIMSIKEGDYFVPNKSDGFFFKKTPSYFGIKPHMFYRQSMMFINFLQATDECGFHKLLLGVENGKPLTTVLEVAYNKKLEELWNNFLSKINQMG